MKSRKVAPPDDASHKEGRWFIAEDFLLLPNMKNVAVDVHWPQDRFKFPSSRSRKSRDKAGGKRSGELTRKQAEAITRRLKRDFKEVVDASNAVYRNEPLWSLRDIPVNSVVEAIELLQEFIDFVDHTTSYFPWMIGPPAPRKELQTHGWKHVTYDLIRELTSSEKSYLVPPAMRADLAGTPDQLLDLIRRAEGRNPHAVARLEFLFPERNWLADACEFTLLEKIPRARLEAIPTVGQLAAEWAIVANRDPESKNAEDARSQLLSLTSKGSALRSLADKGRPRIQEHPTAIKQIYEMNYCLFIQVREVRKFLDRNFPSDEGNRSCLLKFYPWLKDIAGKNIFSFIRDSASTGAMHITGRALRISPGKVQQTLYED